MAVTYECGEPLKEFDDWYVNYTVDSRSQTMQSIKLGPKAEKLWRMFETYRRDNESRFSNYYKLERLADAQVEEEKPNSANVSSGEVGGLMRRLARSLVQNTPNVEIISEFDDDSKEGVLLDYILRSKVIGSDQYSNDMQQHLFASTKTALTTGFQAVVPALCEDALGGWQVEYDSVHYRDVFAELGVTDVRKSSMVFVRRYLTRGEAESLARESEKTGGANGWDHLALRTMLKSSAAPKREQSVDKRTKDQRMRPEGYEVITWYNSWGEDFLTFSVQGEKLLLRMEENRDPLKRHPVHFLVLEADDFQPYGKSQVELVYGRQSFQDLLLNGAMKAWYRNINPTILAYGTTETAVNFGPGKINRVANPNARFEAFEINTSSLMQFNSISQSNGGAMLNLIGSPDQQTASQGMYDNMSATPQGVESQATQIDITTNNFQKAIEGFFSHYCSYALTMYINELQAVKNISPSAEMRQALLAKDTENEWFDDEGKLQLDMSVFTGKVFFVRCVPGSLVELEDEKQVRMLNELFVPLSQAIGGFAQMQDQRLLKNAALAMQFIIAKQISLSGSKHAQQLEQLWLEGDEESLKMQEGRILEVESNFQAVSTSHDDEIGKIADAVQQQGANLAALTEILQTITQQMGISTEPSAL